MRAVEYAKSLITVLFPCVFLPLRFFARDGKEKKQFLLQDQWLDRELERLCSRLESGDSWALAGQGGSLGSALQNPLGYFFWAKSHHRNCLVVECEGRSDQELFSFQRAFFPGLGEQTRQVVGLSNLLERVARSGGDLLKVLREHLRQRHRFRQLEHRLRSSTAQIRYQVLMIQLLLGAGVTLAIALFEEMRIFFVFEPSGQCVLAVLVFLAFTARQASRHLISKCESRLRPCEMQGSRDVLQCSGLLRAIQFFTCSENSGLTFRQRMGISIEALHGTSFKDLFTNGGAPENTSAQNRSFAMKFFHLLKAQKKSGVSAFSSLKHLEEEVWQRIEMESEGAIAKLAPQLILSNAVCFVPAILLLFTSPLIWRVWNVLVH